MALCKSLVDHGAEHGVPFGGEEEKRKGRPPSVAAIVVFLALVLATAAPSR